MCRLYLGIWRTWLLHNLKSLRAHSAISIKIRQIRWIWRRWSRRLPVLVSFTQKRTWISYMISSSRSMGQWHSRHLLTFWYANPHFKFFHHNSHLIGRNHRRSDLTWPTTRSVPRDSQRQGICYRAWFTDRSPTCGCHRVSERGNAFGAEWERREGVWLWAIYWWSVHIAWTLATYCCLP